MIRGLTIMIIAFDIPLNAFIGLIPNGFLINSIFADGTHANEKQLNSSNSIVVIIKACFIVMVEKYFANRDGY